MIVQPLGLFSCHLSNLISSVLSEHFWEVHCKAAGHAGSSTVRVSVHPQTHCSLLNKLFHYLHHYPVYLLHADFGPNMSLTPVPGSSQHWRFRAKQASQAAAGGDERGNVTPGAAAAGLWYWLPRQMKEHWLYEVIGILDSLNLQMEDDPF